MTSVVAIWLLLNILRVSAVDFGLTNGSLTMYFEWLLPPSDNITEVSDLKESLGLLHCNFYCNGSTETRYVSRICSSLIPRCRPCRCDDDCHKYGDCCPSENGDVSMKKQTIFECVSSADNGHYRYGDYLMITNCPNGKDLKVSSASETSQENVSPVTSVITNVTYINENIASCNDDKNFTAWTEENVCQDVIDYQNDSSSDCITYIDPPYNLPVRSCSPLFSKPKYIDTCNVTGLWDGSTFDIDADVQCEDWQYYPVTEGKYVFKNIFCFLCNGFIPTIHLCTIELYSGTSINELVNTFSASNKPQCKENEWYDHIKSICRYMNCRQGYELEGEKCVMTQVSLPNVQYHFNAVFWPSTKTPTTLALRNWSDVESMVVQNIPEVLAAYNISNSQFTVDKIARMDGENSSEIIPSFSLSLMFKTKQNCCRDEFEERLSKLSEDQWIFLYKGSTYVFDLSFGDFYAFVTTESQTYNLLSPEIIPVKTDTILDDTSTEHAMEHIYLPIIILKCVFVHLFDEDFSWNADKSVTLDYANITIQPEHFTQQTEYQLVICVNILKQLYKSYHPSLDAVKQAENIVSLFFSILSLICLTLTFITYCTFTSLLTLPTKNTMCLVVFLFVAQFLLQFGHLASGDETTCKVIGVLLHYFWLSVIFWMNVCSYHMFHVFVIDAAKSMCAQNNYSRMLRYFLYANGSSLIIVVITIGANLGVSSGEEIGYGNGTCYLSTALLVGVCFVLPLGIILILNITFFSISVWTMAKINKMSATIGQDKSQVHIYIKLSTLTGIFWILSILAQILQLPFLVFISVILNASQGVFIFISYMANRRILQLWKGKLSRYISFNRDETTDTTRSTITTSL